MITGYNHNAKYKGEIFHIQTEDGGEKNPSIASHIFFKGNVITSKKTDYREIMNTPNFEKALRLMMQEQHKTMIKGLLHGEFDNLPSLQAVLPKEQKQEVPVKSNVYQIYKPGAEEKLEIEDEEEGKSLDEMVLDYLSEKRDD